MPLNRTSSSRINLSHATPISPIGLMCGFQRIIFDCGHDRNTLAVIFCQNPRNCFPPKVFEIGCRDFTTIDPAEIQDVALKSVRIPGGAVCLECYTGLEDELEKLHNDASMVQKKLEEIQEELAILEEERLTDRKVLSALIQATDHVNEARKRTIRPLGALARAHRLCASGKCSNQAVRTSLGWEGEFCRQHTCSAREWGCLHPVYCPGGAEDRSWQAGMALFCVKHTCFVTGCLGKVSEWGAYFCAMHAYLKEDDAARGQTMGGLYALNRFIKKPGTSLTKKRKVEDLSLGRH